MNLLRDKPGGFSTKVSHFNPFSQEVKKEGKLEEKRKIAIKLLLLKMDVDTIAKVTGLTQIQIEELKKQMLDGKL